MSGSPFALGVTLLVLGAVSVQLAAASWATYLVAVRKAGQELLSSALPYAFDVIALRRVPMHVASTMMSINPVTAVMWGAIILGERLHSAEFVGLAIICAANVLVVRAARAARTDVS